MLSNKYHVSPKLNQWTGYFLWIPVCMRFACSAETKSKTEGSALVGTGFTHHLPSVLGKFDWTGDKP